MKNAVTIEIMDNTSRSLIPNSTLELSMVWTFNAQGFTIKSAWEAVREVRPVPLARKWFG